MTGKPEDFTPKITQQDATNETSHKLLENLHQEQVMQRHFRQEQLQHPGDPAFRALLKDTQTFEQDLTKALLQLPGAHLENGVVKFDSSQPWSPEQIQAVTQLTKQLDQRAQVFQGYTRHLDGMISNTTAMDNYVNTTFESQLHSRK